MPYAQHYFDVGAPLQDLTVEVTGNETFTLGYDDYREIELQDGWRYETVQNVADAEYDFSVTSITDVWGKQANPNITGTYTGAIPDSAVSREPDDLSPTGIAKFGVQIEVNTEWIERIDGRISANTSGAQTAYLYRVSDGILISQTDISSFSAGDVFSMSLSNPLSTSETYNFVLQGDGSNSWTVGRDGNPTFSYSSSDGNIDIVAGAVGASTSSSDADAIVEVGNLK